MAANKIVCQRCGRDLDSGPVITNEHGTMPEVRVGAVIVDTTADGRLLLICRWCAAEAEQVEGGGR